MRTYQTIRNLLLPMLVIAMVAGCQKPDAVTIPPVESHFTFRSAGTYEVLTANSRFSVPVGITTTQKTPTTVEFTITSPTGAVAGTHYTVGGGSNSITIPAGQAIGSIDILGSLAAYSSGRRDTLVITLSAKAGGVSPLSTNTTYRLALRGPCFEGDVTLSTFLGAYNNTNEDFGGPYGPYRTTISAVRQLTATTGEITVTNIYDYGWNPAKFVLNWTNPAARTAIPPQSGRHRRRRHPQLRLRRTRHQRTPPGRTARHVLHLPPDPQPAHAARRHRPRMVRNPLPGQHGPLITGHPQDNSKEAASHRCGLFIFDSACQRQCHAERVFFGVR